MQPFRFALIFAAIALAALYFLASRAASAEPIRIVAFGDSATAGYLVKRNEAYPAQLEAALRAKGYPVSVKNAGVNGDTTKGALRRFDDAIDPDTDIAIVEFGSNDLRAGVPMTKIKTNLAEIVRSLKARGIVAMLVGLGRLDVSDVARAENVPYAQWKLPRGKYRARDGAHYNARGYAIVVDRMLPQIEKLIAQVRNAPR